MARLLGDGLLPESVNKRRRQLRQKLSDLRSPIKERRQELIPGPDVIGKAENTIKDIRTRITTRDSLLEKIGSGSGGDNSGNDAKPSSMNTGNDTRETDTQNV